MTLEEVTNEISRIQIEIKNGYDRLGQLIPLKEQLLNKEKFVLPSSFSNLTYVNIERK